MLSQVSTDGPRDLANLLCHPRPHPHRQPADRTSLQRPWAPSRSDHPPGSAIAPALLRPGDSQPQPARRRALTDLMRETLGVKRETRVSRENAAPLAERHILKGRARSRRLLKRPGSKAAAAERTGGVAPGYVEDAFEARTKRTGRLSSLLIRCGEIAAQDSLFDPRAAAVRRRETQHQLDLPCVG